MKTIINDSSKETYLEKPRRNFLIKSKENKRRRAIYWVSTVLLCLLYLASAAMYLTQGDTVRQGIGALGYPAYLVNVLIVVKLLGVIAIASHVSVRLSDLAYAGMFFHLLLALLAHLNAGDGGFPAAMIGLTALAFSFFTQNAARAENSPYAILSILRSPIAA